MQSAEKPGAMTAMRLLPSLARRATSSTVYGFSHSSLPKRDWNAVTNFASSHPSRSLRSLDVFRQWQW